MSNWKKRYAKFQQQEQEKWLEKKRREEKENYRSLVEGLQSKFKCYICGRLPTIPGKGTDPYDREYVDWDKPGDLCECNTCGKWVCDICRHVYTCQRCAEEKMRKAGFSG